MASNDSGAVGRRGRQLALTSPGAVCAMTGPFGDARAVVGDPVDELMTAAAEFFGGHEADHDMKARASSTMARTDCAVPNWS